MCNVCRECFDTSYELEWHQAHCPPGCLQKSWNEDDDSNPNPIKPEPRDDSDSEPDPPAKKQKRTRFFESPPLQENDAGEPFSEGESGQIPRYWLTCLPEVYHFDLRNRLPFTIPNSSPELFPPDKPTTDPPLTQFNVGSIVGDEDGRKPYNSLIGQKVRAIMFTKSGELEYELVDPTGDPVPSSAVSFKRPLTAEFLRHRAEQAEAMHKMSHAGADQKWERDVETWKADRLRWEAGLVANAAFYGGVKWHTPGARELVLALGGIFGPPRRSIWSKRKFDKIVEKILQSVSSSNAEEDVEDRGLEGGVDVGFEYKSAVKPEAEDA
ncbi:MAG: hypothetical protein M1833_004153 [Piccolia ochrophora]|nr:MAG: hypothetical protein M1833_004153 [Piccolia ochrophora]